MTEDRKHQLDELSVTDILSYLGARASTSEECIRRTDKQFTRAEELLTRFVMASVLFNGKEADLVEEAEQFLKETSHGDEYMYPLPKALLGLWEQTVCEIRGEIKAQGTPALAYAKELCDKLEHSMCALAGGPYELRYSIGD